MSAKVQIEVPQDKIAEFSRKWKITELALRNVSTILRHRLVAFSEQPR